MLACLIAALCLFSLAVHAASLRRYSTPPRLKTGAGTQVALDAHTPRVHEPSALVFSAPVTVSFSLIQGRRPSPDTEDQNHANVQYFVDISLGLPPQRFRSLIDLSWGDLFVPSSRCDDLACAAHSTYNSHLSDTYTRVDEQSDISYLDRHGVGHVSEDTLRIGDLGIAHQPFHALDTLEHEALAAWTPYFDAVLGLAPDNASSSAALQNPFQSMMSQRLLDSNVIGLCLGGTEQPGEITFGGINANLYDGELARIPLTNVTDPSSEECKDCSRVLNGTWQVQARAISWGVSPIENQIFSKYTARLESASPYIYLPEEVYQEIRRLMSPTPGPLFPESIDCKKREYLPDITFDLGGHGFTLTPYQYTLEMAIAGHGMRCINTIRPLHKHHPKDKRVIVLGSAFLRAYYTVLDFDRQELGRTYLFKSPTSNRALTELTKILVPTPQSRHFLEADDRNHVPPAGFAQCVHARVGAKLLLSQRSLGVSGLEQSSFGSFSFSSVAVRVLA